MSSRRCPRTALQEATAQRFRKYARLFVHDDEGGPAVVELGSWESVRQSLGDTYTGREVQRAYKLTWRAIQPHVPGPGEAGRINLADKVSPELRAFVEDPDLLRIPDIELGDVPESAAVLVESQEDYEEIVSNLVVAGMMEREIPEETVEVRGKKITNGMFGVHKAWVQEPDGTWTRSLRLIINLIPTNRLQSRPPIQPSTQMGYAPLWGQMALNEDEIILAYAEDIRHCFHIFAPSPRWRGYFVIGRSVQGRCFQDGIGARGRPRVRTAPMGWCNIVDFVQSALENAGTLAGVPAERVVRMGDPLPLMPVTGTRDYYSFYVDNFDSFKVMAATEQGLYEGKPSDTQLALREVFQCWGVGRDEKKAAEGTLKWSSLGAEQLGDLGLVGSSRKLRRAVLGATVRVLECSPAVPRGSHELLTIVGKAMRSVQFCRPLACMFDELYACLSHEDKKISITAKAETELYCILMSLPMHYMEQRMQICPTVYATDASLEGGGACASVGLSARGRAKCHLLGSDDDMGGGCDAVLVIEAFGGIGGLRKALELIGLQPQGLILIESDPLCQKLARRHCGYVQVVDDIKKVDAAMVRDWRRQFPRAKKVILGGGWPCVHHSRLNANREGAEAELLSCWTTSSARKIFLKGAASRCTCPPGT